MTLARGTLPERFANSVREIIEKHYYSSSFSGIPMEIDEDDTSRYLIEDENEVGSSPVGAEGIKGGIDFRSLPMTCMPMGGFCGLSFSLPNPASIGSIDVDNELKEINLMVERGIIPSGQRVKELIAVCYHRQELAGHAEELMSCLMRICKLEEDMVAPSDKELKEALVIVDSL
jgi:hypothetical protein